LELTPDGNEPITCDIDTITRPITRFVAGARSTPRTKRNPQRLQTNVRAVTSLTIGNSSE
jgi:hypothetical protein